MFPFDYIPQSIDPRLRLFLIFLISVQFISTVFLVVYLTIQHVQKRKELLAKKNSEELLNENEDKKTNTHKETKKNK